MIRYLFNPRDAELIMSVPLVPSSQPGVWVWHFEQSSYFMIKLAYHLGMSYVDKRVGGRAESSMGSDKGVEDIVELQSSTKSEAFPFSFVLKGFSNQSERTEKVAWVLRIDI